MGDAGPVMTVVRCIDASASDVRPSVTIVFVSRGFPTLEHATTASEMSWSRPIAHSVSGRRHRITNKVSITRNTAWFYSFCVDKTAAGFCDQVRGERQTSGLNIFAISQRSHKATSSLRTKVTQGHLRSGRFRQ